MGAKDAERYPVLDGVRAVSILFVLAAHWLPLGPKDWRLNEVFGVVGMSLFFLLSGFLITKILRRDGDVVNFAIRRLTRILPLAWLGLTLTFLLFPAPGVAVLRHFFFVANVPDVVLSEPTAIYWSLCVEVQFYFLVGLLALVFRRRLPGVLIAAWIGAIVLRFVLQTPLSIRTDARIDEILAGCVLAVAHETVGGRLRNLWGRLSPLVLFALLTFCSFPQWPVADHFRSLFTLLLGGSLLFGLRPTLVRRGLESRPMAYVAQVSYALYIWHGFWTGTWLGEGDKGERYLKRPLLAAVTFASAHLSTRTWEQWFIRWGRNLIAQRRRKAGPPDPETDPR